MKLGVLFSGGKDSCYAMFKAKEEHEIACLLSVESENPYSYMFHTPNIGLTKMQAEAMGIPLMTQKTQGEKEIELMDLKALIKKAMLKFNIEGVVTGAIASVYQFKRIQKVCSDLQLQCINPLWQKDQVELLNELVENKFETIITKIAGYPLDQSFLGKKIDSEMIKRLVEYKEKYKINPSGEGGEMETFVTNMPLFRKRIEIVKATTKFSNYEGDYIIEEARLA